MWARLYSHPIRLTLSPIRPFPLSSWRLNRPWEPLPIRPFPLSSWRLSRPCESTALAFRILTGITPIRKGRYTIQPIVSSQFSSINQYLSGSFLVVFSASCQNFIVRIRTQDHRILRKASQPLGHNHGSEINCNDSAKTLQSWFKHASDLISLSHVVTTCLSVHCPAATVKLSCSLNRRITSLKP